MKKRQVYCIGVDRSEGDPVLQMNSSAGTREYIRLLVSSGGTINQEKKVVCTDRRLIAEVKAANAEGRQDRVAQMMQDELHWRFDILQDYPLGGAYYHKGDDGAVDTSKVHTTSDLLTISQECWEQLRDPMTGLTFVIVPGVGVQQLGVGPVMIKDETDGWVIKSEYLSGWSPKERLESILQQYYVPAAGYIVNNEDPRPQTLGQGLTLPLQQPPTQPVQPNVQQPNIPPVPPVQTTPTAPNIDPLA